MTPRPRAVVYRGPATSEGTAEAVAALLESSAYGFSSSYIGPDEALKLTAANLEGVDLYAQPGGPDLDEAWTTLGPHAGTIRTFVARGGKYLGICLGAYLAGHTPGFGLLPRGADTDSEISQDGAQVDTDADAIVEVDWSWARSGAREGHGAGAGTTRRWLFFQDGAMIEGLREGPRVRLLGRYAATGDVAAAVCGFGDGDGRVAVCGPHPEATREWFDEYGLESPDGLQMDLGYDLLAALMDGW